MFWTYIGFCQFMLIWYAGMPEETMFFVPRWEGAWKTMAIVLMIAKFPVPFFVLAGRYNKTRERVVQFMAVWLIFWHFVDMYWNIMPSLKDHSVEYDKFASAEPTMPYVFNIWDFGWLAFGAGLVMVVFYLVGRKGNMVPIGDPKLEHGLHWHA
jgi:cation transport ATPase